MLALGLALRFPDQILGPDCEFRKQIWNWCLIALLAGLGTPGLIFKQQNVSGNGTDAAPTIKGDGTKKNDLNPLLAILLIPAFLFGAGGCAKNSPGTVTKPAVTAPVVEFRATPPELRDGPTTKEKWQTTGKIAAKALGEFALMFGQQWFLGQADRDNKANWMDAAAMGMRTLEPRTVNLEAPVRNIFNTWVPQKPHWQELENITVELVKEGVDLEQISAELNKQADKLRTK